MKQTKFKKILENNESRLGIKIKPITDTWFNDEKKVKSEMGINLNEIYEIIDSTNRYMIPNKKDNEKLVYYMRRYILLNGQLTIIKHNKGDN